MFHRMQMGGPRHGRCSSSVQGLTHEALGAWLFSLPSGYLLPMDVTFEITLQVTSSSRIHL